MSEEAAVYEIVELEEGGVALSRVDGEGEPLVYIKFSEESLTYMQGSKIDIAKVMIEAGLDAVAELNEEASVEEEPVVH